MRLMIFLGVTINANHKRKTRTSPKVVIYGPEGIGKSTFASQFPGTVFIDTEGSTDNMDVSRLNKPSSYTMLKMKLHGSKLILLAARHLLLTQSTGQKA